MGLTTAYLSALKHAATAESLAFRGLQHLERMSPSNSEGALSDVIYNLNASEHAYVCAAQALAPFRQSSDRDTRSFAVETDDAFEGYAIWLRRVQRNIRRRLSDSSGTTVAEADSLAAMRRQRDALTMLLGLNVAGLTQLLVESTQDNRSRLALNPAERDTVLAQLRRISNSYYPEVTSAVQTFRQWLGDPKWPTR
jgi:hypothetical protein